MSPLLPPYTGDCLQVDPSMLRELSRGLIHELPLPNDTLRLYLLDRDNYSHHSHVEVQHLGQQVVICAAAPQETKRHAILLPMKRDPAIEKYAPINPKEDESLFVWGEDSKLWQPHTTDRGFQPHLFQLDSTGAS